MGNHIRNKDYVIGLTDKHSLNSKDMIYISCSSSSEYRKWHTSLIEAIGKDPMPAPIRELEKKKNGNQSKKRVGEFASISFGKTLVKSNLNQETLKLLSGLKKIITKESGKRISDKIEKNILMIITKSYILLNNETLNIESFHKLYEPMNKAIKILCKCSTSKNRIDSKTLEIALLKVEENLKVIEEILTDFFQPYLSSKNMFRITYVFGYLSSPTFLKRLIEEEDFEEDLYTFYDFLEFYSQFN